MFVHSQIVDDLLLRVCVHVHISICFWVSVWVQQPTVPFTLNSYFVQEPWFSSVRNNMVRMNLETIERNPQEISLTQYSIIVSS